MNSQLIKEYANQDLKAISHRLWEQANRKSKDVPQAKTNELRRILELYRMSYFLRPSDSLIQTFIIITLFLPIFLRGHSLQSQLETAVTFTLVLHAMLRLGDYL